MKKIKLLFLLITATAATVSCDLGDEAPSYGDSRAIVGFPRTTQSASIVTDGTDKTINAAIELIGGNNGLPVDQDVAVTYEVDAASTATEGVQFNFPTANRTVIIPAGSKTVLVPITVHSGAIVVGSNKNIVLKITGASSASATVVGSNFSKVRITLVGQCFSNLAGNYVLNYTSGPQPVLITAVGIGEYKSNITPGFTQYDMYFSDVCGTLRITDWTHNATNAISGVGQVQSNGDLRFTNVTIVGVAGYTNLSWLVKKVI
ncbi:hypothetical protein [Flavobacterium inviolabile]|uniref:hypothetical protein n=1 Tax=Flavobacterium inviolabile TaxID=2748320 RepID=UPI0015A87BA1|nr:hypothetical protein [Flavobacterium inviolabile]